MRRIVLDSCAFDKFVENPDWLRELILAAESGEVEFLSSHVQHDELLATPDEAKRTALIEAWGSLVELVPTGGAVWGVSRWGQARWFGDNDDVARFDQVLRTPASGTKDGRPGNTNDALIVDTAAKEGAEFVTAETGRALRVPRKIGVPALSVEQLIQEIRQR